MNIRAHLPIALPADAGSFERRLWTVTDLRRLEDAGILGPEERVELIAGEIVRMAPKGARHEVVRNELTVHWARRLPPAIKFAEEAPLKLDDHTEPEPDIILFPAALKVHQVRGDDVLLVVEVADTSLRWDTETKAKVYATFGVAEYWVVDANTLETRVHRSPSAGAYSAVETVLPGETLTPTLVPALSVSLGDLDLD